MLIGAVSKLVISVIALFGLNLAFVSGNQFCSLSDSVGASTIYSEGFYRFIAIKSMFESKLKVHSVVPVLSAS